LGLESTMISRSYLGNGWYMLTLSDESNISPLVRIEYQFGRLNRPDIFVEIMSKYSPDLITANENWKLENNPDNPQSSLDIKLMGCSNIKFLKTNYLYRTEIRFEEETHNQRILVEADVLVTNGGRYKEYSKVDLQELSEIEFTVEEHGSDCKNQSLQYCQRLMTHFDAVYFEAKNIQQGVLPGI